MKTLILFLVLIMTGCRSKPDNHTGPTKECLIVQELVEKNISAGSSSVVLLDFFKSNGWKADYDKLDKAYIVQFSYGGFWSHVVHVKVWMRNDGTVERYKVQDLYTAL